MTRTRIHNFSISLDGFATGEGQALDTPFGHAGHRLHEWMIATRFGAPILGARAGPPASTTRLPSSTSRASAPRSWARTSSAHRAGRTTPTGRDGGARTPRS